MTQVRAENASACTEWPGRLWSLWDMLDFYARDFMGAVEKAEKLKRLASQAPEGLPVPFSAVSQDMTILDSHLQGLNLPISCAQMVRIGKAFQDEVKQPVSGFAFANLLNELRQRIDDELLRRVFYGVTSEHTGRFFNGPQKNGHMELRPLKEIYGEATMTTFFLADEHDPVEAVRCLTRGCDTGAVFHLMRMLEIGLGSLCTLFNVSMAHSNWGPALEELESKIKVMHKDPCWNALGDCKERQEAYGQAASHFDLLRLAWRNYTAHARGKYTEDEADSIFRNVKGFLAKVADVLRRYPATQQTI